MKLFNLFLELNGDQLNKLISKCKNFLLKLDFPEKEI